MLNHVLSVWTVVAVKFNDSQCGFHFKHNNDVWYVKVFDLASGASVANQTVNITSYYLE